MKNIFRTVTALSLACGVFAFTGCNDYEEDINSINNRLDELTTGQIASMDDQIKSLGDAIDEAKGLITTLQGDVDALETAKETLEGEIETLNGSIGTINGNIATINGKIDDLQGQLDDADADIVEINGQISALQDDLAEQTGLLAELTETVAELSGDVAALEALTEGLPELEQTVADIEANYLSKTEAAETYATIEELNKINADLLAEIGEVSGRLETIEALDIAERLTALETDYKDIIETVIPGIKEDITAAQSAADAAQAAADKAQARADEAYDKAVEVLGQLDVLKEALGVYAEAGKLDAKIKELEAEDAALAAKDTELQGLIDDLGEAHAADIQALKDKIGDVQGTIAEALADINSAIDEINGNFAANVLEQIKLACQDNGVISNTISAAISTAKTEIQGKIDAVDAKVAALDGRLTAVEEKIEDLEDRIQSLVFVPEFNDDNATVYSYTINGVSVSDVVVAKATFQVTPAALAENVVNQYRENVVVNVVPVKTRGASAGTPVTGENLKVEAGAGNGYIDVEVTLPVEYADGGCAFSLYVASKEEVAAIIGEEETVVDMDAGTYISSEYVQTTAKVTELSDAYVLYSANPVNAEYSEYPVLTGTMDDYLESRYVSEVNSYERAWSYADEAKYVYLYGDNTITEEGEAGERNHDSYTLRIKIDRNGDGSYSAEEYLTLDDAAALFHTDKEKITPVFSSEVKYYDRNGSEIENDGYFEVIEKTGDNATEEEPYGVSIMATDNIALAVNSGAYVDVEGSFSFTGEDHAAYDYDEAVITTAGRYTVINEPARMNVEKVTIPWTYETAKKLADQATSPWTENAKPIDNVLTFTVEKLGDMDLAIFLLRGLDKDESYVERDGIKMSPDEAPVLTFVDRENMKLTWTEEGQKGTIVPQITGYEFGHEYHFVYVYENTGAYNTTLTLDFTLELGPKPTDATYTYAEAFQIPFMLPTTGLKHYGEAGDGFALMFGELGENASGWFTDAATFETSLTEGGSSVVYTTLRNGEEELAKDEPQNGNAPLTRLNITKNNETDPDVPENLSYVRVSSMDVTSANDVFGFTTTFTTWYGVTYTFEANAEIEDPDYKLNYIPTHITGYEDVDLDNPVPGPFVTLRYYDVNGVYMIEEANLRDYFRVYGGENYDQETRVEDMLSIEFEVMTKEDAAKGYIGVPVIPALTVGADGLLVDSEGNTIDWSEYEARDLQIKATLVAKSAADAQPIEINSLYLDLKTDAIITGFAPKADGAEGYRAPVSADADGIVISWHNDKNVDRDKYSDGSYDIYLWEYLEATTIYSDGENIIPMENQSGVRHTSVAWANSNSAMAMYHAGLRFGDCIAVSGGRPHALNGADVTSGVLHVPAQDGTVENDIFIEIPVTLYYYLDYNDYTPAIGGSAATGTETGIVTTDDTVTPVGARQITLKIKITD